MSTTPVTIPPLREDFAVKRYSGRYYVEDAVRRLRVPIDPLTLQVMEILAEGPAIPEPLVEALEVPADEVYQRVALLAEHLLLDTRRAEAQRQIHLDAASEPLWPTDTLPDAPLRYPAELQHGCVACGACCHGTDVGPLSQLALHMWLLLPPLLMLMTRQGRRLCLQ